MSGPAPTVVLSGEEPRAITAAGCARQVLDLFDDARPADHRPREAIEAAEDFAAGARRGSRRGVPAPAGLRPPGPPRPGSAVHQAGASELAAGDDHDVGDARLERAAGQVPAHVVDVLARMSLAPAGRTRAAALLTRLDARLRG